MGKKILLADDSITIQKVIELTFSDEDFEVVTVGNGRLAIERVQEVRPDFVLCDIIMPEKDGYEVCDFIKKTPGLSHIPVLLLTGAFEPFDQEKANRVGANGFLAKPFEPQSLIKKVKDLLAQAAPAPAAAARPAPMPAPASPAPAPIAMPPAPPPPPMVPLPPLPAAAATPPAPLPDEAFMVEEVPEAPVEVEAAVAPEVEELPMEATPAPPAAVEEPAFEEVPSEWGTPTAEVPLETRAQAGREAAMPQPPVFDEVFDETPPAGLETEPPTEPAGFETEPLAAAEALAPEEPAVEPEIPEALPDTGADVPVFEPSPAPVSHREAAPVPAPSAGEASFADLGGADEERVTATAPSEAAEVPVPVDMVERIAQRVVAQVSEKVVREIAWEVIPELAEALIKKEIERLKAELEEL